MHVCFKLKSRNCEGPILLVFHSASIKTPVRSYREAQLSLLKTACMVCVSWCQYEASLAFTWYLIWQVQYLINEAKIYATSFRWNSSRNLSWVCLLLEVQMNTSAPCKSLCVSVSHQRASHLCEPQFAWTVSRLRLSSSLSCWMEDFSSWPKVSDHTPDPSASRRDQWKLDGNFKVSAPSGRLFVTWFWKWKHKSTFAHSFYYTLW